jgi:hypothetical protein
MPLLLRLPARGEERPRDRAPLLIGIRRLAVVVILLLANGYNLLVGSASSLSSIGLVAFVAVAQFAPAMVGGLYWRQGNWIGALADRTGRARDLHQAIQHDRRRFDDVTIRSLALGLEADAIDRTVGLGYPQYLGDELAQPVMRRKIVD